MNYYNEIKTKIIEEENYSKLKDYSKERHKTITYYEIGRMLSEAGTEYGENIIGKYAIKLQKEFGKKYNKRTLYRIRQFYITFKDSKVSPMGTQLSWSHFKVLLPIKEETKLYYYINIVSTNNLTKRELEEKIKNKEYERLDTQTRLKIINQEEPTIKELIKNPIIIKSKRNTIKLTEKDLQTIILEELPSFLEELGTGFSFIKNEYKIKIGDRYNFIDLLLYNIEYNCYVVIELKVTELKKEHIGQIEVYMNYIDNNLKKITQDKTIGIIICKKDNHFIMEYCSDRRNLSREYLLENKRRSIIWTTAMKY